MASIGKEINSKFESEQQKLLINVLFTANWLQNEHVCFLKPFGISPQQYNILRILRGAGDFIPMTTVKERMIETSPNATRLADKLLDKKLIERQKGKHDGRVIFVGITELGLKMLADISELDEHPILPKLDFVSDEKAEEINTILDELRSK